MARQRMIKPEFWQDETISQLTRDARLLYIGLWNYADDEGRLELTARRVKAQIFPYDEDISSDDVQKMIDELVSLSRIVLYTVGGKELAFIPRFRNHQTINRPMRSIYPACDDSLICHGVISDDSVSTHAQVKLKEDNLKEDNIHSVVFPEEKNNDVDVNAFHAEPKQDHPRIVEFSPDFQRFWNAYPQRANRKTNKRGAWKSWQTVSRDHDFPGIEYIVMALNYQKDMEPWQEHRARNQPCIVPLVTTYLNQRRWQDVPEDPFAGD